MAVIETWLTQDLKKPVPVQQLCGNFFSHNGNANRIGVRVYNGDSPATLSGTVSGYAVLTDGTTVPCTGSLSGNEASILLPAAAYVPGNIFITIMLTSGTTITTLAALAGNVVRARTDSQVDPGSVVTDWTNTINAALQTVENYTGNIIATPYASLTYPVPLGKYCIYNNLLYRCVSPIASSENWTASHWTQVKLADDVSDLKSALKNRLVLVTWSPTLQKGKYIKGSDGTSGNSNKFARTSVWVGLPDKVAVEVTNPTYEYYISKYNENGAIDGTGYIGYDGIYHKGLMFIDSPKFGISFRRTDQTDLQDSDITAITAALKCYQATDVSLTIAGVSADAKITGENFSGINSILFNKSSLQERESAIVERGINTETGEVFDSFYRFSTGRQKFGALLTFTTDINETYLFTIVGYDDTAPVMQPSNNEGLAEAYIGATVQLPFDGSIVTVSNSWYYCGIDFRRKDGAVVSSADIDYVKNHFYVLAVNTDETLSKKYYPADAQKTGTEINNLYEKIEFNNATYAGVLTSQRYAKTADGLYPISSGYYDRTTGSESSSQKYARNTYKNISLSGKTIRIVIEPYTVYEFMIVFWDKETNAYIPGRATQNYFSAYEGLSLYIRDNEKFAANIRRIDGANLTSDDLDAIKEGYKIFVEQSGSGVNEGITTKRNNPNYVTQLLEIGETYMNHGLVYGTNTILRTSSSTNKLDCSTFVGLVLRGYEYEDTSYYTHNYVDPKTWVAKPGVIWAVNPFDYVFPIKEESDTLVEVNRASQLCEWMTYQGQRVPIDTYYANLRPGDVLFFSRKDKNTGEWVAPDRYLKISHCAFVYSKEKAPDDPSWDSSTFPYKHMMIEATKVTNTVQIQTLETYQNDEAEAIYHNDIFTLVAVCRPDLGSI